MVEREYPPAGRAMDRLVAERFLGWKAILSEPYWPDWQTNRTGEPSGRWGLRRSNGIEHSLIWANEEVAWEVDCPHFSTEIEDAWDVWREAIVRFGGVTIRADMEDYGREPGDICWVTVDLVDMDAIPEGEEALVEVRSIIVFGDFPYAMCKAALMALDAEEKEQS